MNYKFKSKPQNMKIKMYNFKHQVPMKYQVYKGGIQ